MNTFLEYMGSDILTLFVVLSPMGVMPFFQGLTANATGQQKNMIANRAIVIAAVLLAFFALIGDLVLGFLGITLQYIMIAGGLYILVFAVKNALGREDYTDRGESAEGKSKGLPEAVAHKIAIVPLATPLLAGPGSIATVMILNDEPSGITTTIAAIVVNAILAWLILRSSNKLARVLSPSILMILNTVMNILIAAIGVAFVLKGASGAFSIGIK